MRPAGLDEPSVQLGTITTEFSAPINAPSHAAYAPLEAVSSGNDAPTHVVPDHSFKAAAKVNASFGDPGQGMAIAFKDITYTVPVKEKGKTIRKQILKGVTGSIRSGSLNAIMGPSGGGKVPFAARPPKLGRISPRSHHLSANCVRRHSGFSRAIAQPCQVLIFVADLGYCTRLQTSLLDVLADRKPKSTVNGQVLTDGVPRNSDTFMHMAGYVVQDDIVMGTLTVRENLLFSARLRLPDAISDSEKKRRVQEVIQELGLEKVADVRCGNEFVRGISGGERKRVNIGMELVMAPSVLFLDEPTTGLDAATSMSVLRLLKRLAEHGRTIVLSIHQPRFRIFEMFDLATIMSQGEMLYQGDSARCVGHFAQNGYQCDSFNNPADFIMDVVLGIQGRQDEKKPPSDETDNEVRRQLLADVQTKLSAAYRESPMAEAALQRFEHDRANPKQRGADGHATGTYAASWLTQVWVCSGRALANVVRNPATSIGQVMVNIVVGVLVGCIFWQINGDNEPNRQMRDKTGFIFFVMVNLMFSNMGGIEVFLKERVIFMHEKASGYYRTSAYYVSKLLCDLVPVRVVPTAIFATTVYFMAGLQYKVDKFFWFLLIAELQSIAASAVCFLFSCMFSIFAIANLSTTMFYVLTMIFSGLLVSVTKWPDGTRWLGYTSFAKYSYELALENELTGLTFDCSRGGPCTGEEALGELYLNIETGNWGMKIGVLCAFIFGFLSLGYFQLRRLQKH